ncbi:hypothetical protein Tco_1161152 [Tanacetum coccineum]
MAGYRCVVEAIGVLSRDCLIRYVEIICAVIFISPRALVYAGLVTSGDARSSYMISGDAKSWVCLHIFTVILHNCPLCVINKGKFEVLGIKDEYIWEFIEGQLFDFFQGCIPVFSSLTGCDRLVIRAKLVDTDIESDLEKDPLEAKESQPLGSRVPLMSEEFEASKPPGTRTVSSHSPVSSDSTAPLSPDHPLTHVSPTPTPTQVLFHRRTARMAVRTQPTLSPGMSARIAEAAALSPSSFCKRYRSSYETPSSSLSSLTLPVWKRYQGTSELILDTDSEGDELGDEDTKEDESSDADDKREGQDLDDEGQGLDDEGQGSEDEGYGMKEEEEAAPKGQHHAVPVVDTAVSEPLGLGYGAARRRALESIEEIAPSTYEVGQSSSSVPDQEGVERISSFKQPTLVKWVDPKDNRVYTNIPAYAPPAAPI